MSPAPPTTPVAGISGRSGESDRAVTGPFVAEGDRVGRGRVAHTGAVHGEVQERPWLWLCDLCRDATILQASLKDGRHVCPRCALRHRLTLQFADALTPEQVARGWVERRTA